MEDKHIKAESSVIYFLKIFTGDEKEYYTCLQHQSNSERMIKAQEKYSEL